MFPQPVPFASPFVLIARRQRRETVVRCMKKLPGEYMTIIRMRYYRDLQFTDIARVLQSSENAVVQTHARVLEAMRGHLKTAGVEQFDEL
jgi:DNA-directed RNA polymerase specialized sigma24 family protein